MIRGTHRPSGRGTGRGRGGRKGGGGKGNGEGMRMPCLPTVIALAGPLLAIVAGVWLAVYGSWSA